LTTYNQTVYFGVATDQQDPQPTLAASYHILWE